MLLSLLIILLIAAIAFWHYKQGFFKATVSAILAIIAAVLACSFQETIVQLAFKDKLPDLSNAISLTVLFALVYIILRVVFDKLLPGKLTLPPLADKVGGAAAGVVAGIFAIGVAVIAAENLPVGPAILGYTRLETSSDSASGINNKLVADKYEDAASSHLILPVDDMVANVTSHLSSGGALAGSQSMAAIHPAYLDELFLQRFGVQAGARHVAINIPNGTAQATLRGLFIPPANYNLPVQDSQPKNATLQGRWATPPQIGKPLKPNGAEVILIARISIARSAADSDGNVRLGPGSVRIVANGKDYFPIGTIDWYEAPVLRANRLDDFIVMSADGSADFVFRIASDDFLSDPKTRTIAPGAFLEVKRMALIGLSGTIPQEAPPALAEGSATVLFPPSMHPPKPKPVESTIVEDAKPQLSGELPIAINVGKAESDGATITLPNGVGTATTRERKFTQFELKPVLAMANLAPGDAPIKELAAPEGQRVVQIVAVTPSKATDPWEWATKLSQFEIIDGSDAPHKPHGAWAQIVVANPAGEVRVVGRYNADAEVADLSKVEGRPTDLRLFFVVPEGVSLKELRYGGQRVISLGQPGK